MKSISSLEKWISAALNSLNSSQASYIYLNFWAFENPPPHPQGISNPFCGGSMDIFWNYALEFCKFPNIFTPYQKAWILSLQTALYIFKMNTMYLPITDH